MIQRLGALCWLFVAELLSPPQYSYVMNKEIQLTKDASGHTINSTQCFSPDDQWIVYDARNVDTGITSTGEIGMVNTQSGEIRSLYKTQNQTEFGPGVGAATFSPKGDKVIFIHGVRNADASAPYSITRRTGIAVDPSKAGKSIFMDARDITPPFTPGALRGGTHAHSWSGDGQWISFTYNDFVIEQLAKTRNSVRDMRTIGIMVPVAKGVSVGKTASLENNDGEMFSLIAAAVTETPKPGSDEIDKAFDESWIGLNGYAREDGTVQKRAIAFQGNVVDMAGKVKTEIFVADIPGNILEKATTVLPTAFNHIPVPEGITQRRITFTDKGLSTYRHWLRTTPDGRLIGFMADDSRGVRQVFTVSPNGGPIRQITRNEFPVQVQFSFSPDGKQVAYAADNSIFVTSLADGKTERLTPKVADSNRPLNGVVWSNDGKKLAYNRYVKQESGTFLQIFLLGISQ